MTAILVPCDLSMMGKLQLYTGHLAFHFFEREACCVDPGCIQSAETPCSPSTPTPLHGRPHNQEEPCGSSMGSCPFTRVTAWIIFLYFLLLCVLGLLSVVISFGHQHNLETPGRTVLVGSCGGLSCLMWDDPAWKWEAPSLLWGPGLYE